MAKYYHLGGGIVTKETIKQAWELKNSAKDTISAVQALRTILIGIEQLEKCRRLDFSARARTTHKRSRSEHVGRIHQNITKRRSRADFDYGKKTIASREAIYKQTNLTKAGL